jgi:ketosteroid isomerase-like protein
MPAQLPTPGVTLTEPMPTVATLQAILDAFNRHDLDAIMAFFADDAIFDAPRGPDPHGTRFAGKADIREILTYRLRGAVPDVHYADVDHFVAGNRGASEWTLTATAPDGTRLELRGCDIWTFREGLVTRKDTFWKIVEPQHGPLTRQPTAMRPTRP